MTDAQTCVRCGSQLTHVETDGGGSQTPGVYAHHYRCQDRTCLADGGSVVFDGDGVVRRLVGPAVDASYRIREVS